MTSTPVSDPPAATSIAGSLRELSQQLGLLS
jgi:hypothetical protein